MSRLMLQSIRALCLGMEIQPEDASRETGAKFARPRQSNEQPLQRHAPGIFQTGQECFGIDS